MPFLAADVGFIIGSRNELLQQPAGCGRTTDVIFQFGACGREGLSIEHTLQNAFALQAFLPQLILGHQGAIELAVVPPETRHAGNSSNASQQQQRGNGRSSPRPL